MSGFAVVIPTIREDCLGLWQEAWAPDLAGKARVIVVEDNPSVGAALKAALEQAGHSVHLFGDGPSTLAAASTLKPDGFVLDIGLPGMDGCELAAKLKQQSETAGALCIAVSGLKQYEHGVAADGNFDHYFTKPVDVPALLALFDKYVSR